MNNYSFVIPCFNCANFIKKKIWKLEKKLKKNKIKYELILDDDGKKYKIFGEGGVKKTAEEFNKEFMGEIPIDPEVGKCGDEGKPIVEANPDHEISKIYLNLAKKIRSTYL